MRQSVIKACLALAAAHLAAACAKGSPSEAPGAEPAAEVASAAAVKVDMLATGLKFPWSLAFSPNGDLLIIEKAGGLRIFRNGALLPTAVPGLPGDVMVNSDSGLHDIALDPDFEATRRVFIAYASGDDDANSLAVWRARLEGDRLVGGEVILKATPAKKGPSHPGGRILFLPDKTFLLTVGDGYDYRNDAQDLASHLGKILRLDRDGKAPPDNPFAARGDARPEIWTYGHRNPQGLAIDPATGIVWESEHGPRGGDEINRIEKGGNYGWPLTTNGVDYDGTLVSERAHAPGIVSPLIVWAPSIAPSGLAVYRGGEFADWSGHFLVGALAAKSLMRAQTDNDGRSIDEAERLLADIGARIRDVRVGPDGFIYILTDEPEGRLLRLCRAC
jgi:glucose/arabinose dehydrogenase